MNRILFYHQPNTNQTSDYDANPEPVTWFDGIYIHNEIPFQVLFNKEKLVSSKTGGVILDKGQRFFSSFISEILRIEWHESGSIVHLNNHSFWTTAKSIDEFETDLDGLMFFRVHAHHLVNIHYVKRFVICDAFITLNNSEAIPVDSQNDQSFLEFLDDQQLID